MSLSFVGKTKTKVKTPQEAKNQHILGYPKIANKPVNFHPTNKVLADSPEKPKLKLTTNNFQPKNLVGKFVMPQTAYAQIKQPNLAYKPSLQQKTLSENSSSKNVHQKILSFADDDVAKPQQSPPKKKENRGFKSKPTDTITEHDTQMPPPPLYYFNGQKTLGTPDKLSNQNLAYQMKMFSPDSKGAVAAVVKKKEQ